MSWKTDKGGMNKRAQEEMVGFVLIVVIVAVIFLVFLGILLRQGKTDSVKTKESVEIYQFLESMMEYSANCSRDASANYYKISELIQECNSDSGKKCYSDIEVCDVANKTLINLLNASFQVGQERPIKGYVFDSVYNLSINYTDSSAENTIIRISKGSCGKTIRGAEYLIPSGSGSIASSLKLCY